MKKLLSIVLSVVMLLSMFNLSILSAYADGECICTVNYYLMNTDMSTYTLDKTETATYDSGTEVTPEVISYDGFDSPTVKTFVITKDKTVNYFYSRKTFTIKYVTEGTTDTPEDQTKIYGVDSYVTKIQPVREGYSFVGWSKTENGDEVDYKTNEKIIEEKDLTLYAIWDINTYVITFDPDGGTYCDPVVYQYGDKFGELPTLEKSGYSFTGWYYDSELNEPVKETDDVYKVGDAIIYAGWVKRQITALSIKQLPNKLSYYKGDNIDTTGLVLEAKYDNGEIVYVEKGFKTDITTLKSNGSNKVTVTFEGKICSFNVTVEEVVINSLTVDTLPNKVKYYVNDTFDKEGMIVKAGYNNGSEKVIDKNYDVSYDFTEAGTITVTVSYTEKNVTVSDNFNVSVINSPVVYSENKSVQKNDIVEIPVYIKNSVGLMGFHFSIDYDADALTIDSVKQSSLYSNGLFDDTIGVSKDGTIDVVWSGNEEITEDGLLFTMCFKVNDVKSGDYPVSISSVYEDTINKDYDEVMLDCESLTVTISNEHYVEIPKLCVDNTSAKCGENLTVPVYVKNGTSLNNLNMTVEYNGSSLQPVSVESSAGGEVEYASDDSSLLINAENFSITSDNEQLLIITFKVTDSATSEESITISADAASSCQATITIEEKEEDYSATLYAQDIDIASHTVSVPIYAKSDYDIMGYGFNVTYDTSVLELTSVTCGKNYSSGLFAYTDKDGVVSVVWNETENIQIDGQLFLMNFDIIDSDASSTNLKISCNQDDTFDEDWNPIVFQCDDIQIEFKSDIVVGDVNGDSNVNLKDLLQLKQHVAGGYSISINQKNADINKDSSIGLLDIVLLERYLDGTFDDVNSWFVS